METVTAKINQIHDQFKVLEEDPIELPQIVVIGSQSSGKSSVLETLVRRSFLPRGSGIVTRCPLVLQLHHCPLDDERRVQHDTSSLPDEWAEFLRIPGRVFKMDEICREIQRETDQYAGPGQNISKDPITLKIFSPNVLDLTLVDLPGLTQVAVGDQDPHIREQINALVLSYISNPLSIILAIVAANVDLATNDCLRLAKEVDPDGSRTLAVVSKLDLMDKGTDAREVLTGKLLPVKLGIIGVINRSQQDLNDKKPIEEALNDERKFFKDKYPDLASRMGTPYLLKELSSLLLLHIKKNVPSVKIKVQRRIQDCRYKLETTGNTIEEPAEFLTSVICKFAETFSSKLKSEAPDTSRPILYGGAQINYILRDLQTVVKKVVPCDAYSLQEVIMAIRNADGPRPPLLVSLYAFEILMKPLLENMLEPSLTCVESVIDELQNVCDKSCPKEIGLRFPILKRQIGEIVGKIMQECSAKTRAMVKDSITIELGHVTYGQFDSIEMLFPAVPAAQSADAELPFKNDPNYSSSSGYGNSPEDQSSKLLEMAPKDRQQVLVLANMLNHYYDAMSKHVTDGVIKAIMTYLVNAVNWCLSPRLTIHLLQPELMKDLFQEDERTVQDRLETSETLEVLENVLKVLNTVV